MGRTIKDLTNEVSKITDIKVASSTQSVSTNTEVVTRRVSNTRVSLHAVEEPSTERTCSCGTTPASTTKGLSYVTHKTSQAPTETYEVTKTSAVAMTTVSALKPTPALIKSKGNIHIYPQNDLSVI